MYHVSNFYKFFTISAEQITELQQRLERFASEQNLFGLIIVATEGLNGTVSSSDSSAVTDFEEQLIEISGNGTWEFKRSCCEKAPFKRFKVKVRDEIVTAGGEGSPEVKRTKNSLTPQEWQQILSSEEDFVLLDIRNYYETELGKFCGAIEANLVNFQQFGVYLDQSEIAEDKKVLMYCTGGIRCEKAIFEMEERGYQWVFQLEGGILKYLEQFPNEHFEGECFVFDHRVAVRQNLEASTTYEFCPHCGQPGKEEIDCDNCQAEAKICQRCKPQDFKTTCSKDCAEQLRRKRLKNARNVANS